MDTLVIPAEDGGPGIEIKAVNGFVARCVGAIAAENIPDAIRAAEILNAAVQAAAPAAAPPQHPRPQHQEARPS